MKRRGLLLLCLLAGAACKDRIVDQGVLVTVRNPSNIVGITGLRVYVSNRGAQSTLVFPAAGQTAVIDFPTSFTITVPSGRAGQVDIAIDALNSSQAVVGSTANFALIQTDAFAATSFDLRPGVPSCGNRQIDPGETCDDGGRFSGDGCSYVCQTENGADGSAGKDGASGFDTGGGTGKDVGGTGDVLVNGPEIGPGVEVGRTDSLGSGGFGGATGVGGAGGQTGIDGGRGGTGGNVGIDGGWGTGGVTTTGGVTGNGGSTTSYDAGSVDVRPSLDLGGRTDATRIDSGSIDTGSRLETGAIDTRPAVRCFYNGTSWGVWEYFTCSCYVCTCDTTGTIVVVSSTNCPVDSGTGG